MTFELAAQLPAIVADTWRTPEAWQRLAAARTTGTRYHELPGFLTLDAATELRAAALALPFVRLTTPLLDAQRRLLAADELSAWLDLMQSAALRSLVSDVLQRTMPEGLVVNAWLLARGDHMGVHPDGPLYRGTLSLGLTPEWTSHDGGAIAFGERDGETFTPRQRWYPHLGDACLFAPDVDTWHVVEPVLADKPRHSVTGWWTALEDGLTRGRSP